MGYEACEQDCFPNLQNESLRETPKNIENRKVKESHYILRLISCQKPRIGSVKTLKTDEKVEKKSVRDQSTLSESS